MPKSYNTRQKREVEEIIDVFGGKHFTAEDFLEKSKEQGKTVGFTTVYRHLDRMVKEGFLRKYVSGNGESACYQKIENCGEHFHLKCSVCGGLFHLSCKSLESISAHVKNEHGFIIDPSKTVFYGTCEECRSK